MKLIISVLCLSVVLFACQPAAETTADEPDPGQVAFEQNSKTVMAVLEGWQNENMDYSLFADNYASVSTMYDAPEDSIYLDQVKAMDAEAMAAFDFELVTDPVNLLPGVDINTKKQDGSVRYYGEWKVTRTATDSTEAVSGTMMLYSAYVFNPEGKITMVLTYGDFSGFMANMMAQE